MAGDDGSVVVTISAEQYKRAIGGNQLLADARAEAARSLPVGRAFTGAYSSVYEPETGEMTIRFATEAV